MKQLNFNHNIRIKWLKESKSHTNSCIFHTYRSSESKKISHRNAADFIISGFILSNLKLVRTVQDGVFFIPEAVHRYCERVKKRHIVPLSTILFKSSETFKPAEVKITVALGNFEV